MKISLKTIGNCMFCTAIDNDSLLASVKTDIEVATAKYPHDVGFAAWDAVRAKIAGMDFDKLWSEWIYPRQSEMPSHHFYVTMTPRATGAINSVGSKKPLMVSVRAWSYETDRDVVKARVLDALERAYTESEIFYYKATCER